MSNRIAQNRQQQTNIPDYFASSARKIRGFQHRTNLNFGLAIKRSPLDPFHRVFQRFHLPDPVAAYEFLGLGKGPSITILRSLENLTRLLFELGRNPYAERNTPAFSTGQPARRFAVLLPDECSVRE
jgi:hypothetical protein